MPGLVRSTARQLACLGTQQVQLIFGSHGIRWYFPIRNEEIFGTPRIPPKITGVVFSLGTLFFGMRISRLHRNEVTIDPHRSQAKDLCHWQTGVVSQDVNLILYILMYILIHPYVHPYIHPYRASSYQPVITGFFVQKSQYVFCFVAWPRPLSHNLGREHGSAIFVASNFIVCYCSDVVSAISLTCARFHTHRDLKVGCAVFDGGCANVCCDRYCVTSRDLDRALSVNFRWTRDFGGKAPFFGQNCFY